MFTYGPVPSRRLGRSLGVSPISPKTCSYSCVYCQLGRTTKLSVDRESFYDRREILKEIEAAILKSTIDYATFVGDGEPTLNRDLGWLIRQTKELTGIYTSVITNGSLLWRTDVRDDLLAADVVLPTLDAGNEKTFRAINRPHPQITYQKMLDGLVAFREEYHGQIWLEVMLVEGLNDSDDELTSIREAASLVQPDRIYVVTPIRPPAERWVNPPDERTVLRAQHLFGTAVVVADSETGQFGLDEFTDARQAILEIGSRHPLRKAQAADIERSFGATGVVETLLEDGEMIEATYRGTVFLLPRQFRRGKHV